MARPSSRRSAHPDDISFDLLRRIADASDLDTILQRVADAASRLCRSELSAIALREAGTGEMVFRYRSGRRRLRSVRMVVVRGRGAGGLVLATGRSFRSANLPRDRRVNRDEGYMAAVRAEGIVSVLCVPIVAGGAIIGLVWVDNRSRRPFGTADETRLRHLAAHAAVAIRGAQAREARAAACAVCGRLIETDALVVYRHGELIHERCRPRASLARASSWPGTARPAPRA
ncbi:MAG: GAF domain-containing protein [Candidatus Rokubacteria bacterium]|nr:GAF domain-containing protein [Candidatus Rokubacteria bacterium]